MEFFYAKYCVFSSPLVKKWKVEMLILLIQLVVFD